MHSNFQSKHTMSVAICFLTIFATAVAVDYVTTCGAQRAKFEIGDNAGCLCRFNDGTQKCVSTFSTSRHGLRNLTYTDGMVTDPSGNGCLMSAGGIYAIAQFNCEGGELAGICNPGEDVQCCNTDLPCESCKTGLYCDRYTETTTTTTTTTTTPAGPTTESAHAVGSSTSDSKMATTAFTTKSFDQKPLASTRSEDPAHLKPESSTVEMNLSMQSSTARIHATAPAMQPESTDVIDAEQNGKMDRSAEQDSSTLLFIIVFCSVAAICLLNIAWWLFKMIREEKLTEEDDNEKGFRDFANYAAISPHANPVQQWNADYVSVDIDAVFKDKDAQIIQKDNKKAGESGPHEPYNVLPTTITEQADCALQSANNTSPYHQGLSALAQDHYCEIENL